MVSTEKKFLNEISRDCNSLMPLLHCFWLTDGN